MDSITRVTTPIPNGVAQYNDTSGLMGSRPISTDSGISSLGGFFNSMNTQFGSWGSMAGDALSGIGSIVGQYTTKYGDTFTDSQASTQSLIRKGLSAIPVYGQAIAAATGALDAIGSMTGTNLSNINKDSAKRLGLKGVANTNNIINHIPGLSALSGGFGLWSERTNSYQLSDEAEELQAGYSGTLGDLRATEDIANKRLFNRGANKANSIIDEARRKDLLLSQINETNTMRKQSNYYQDLNHQNINRYAGQNYLGVSVGRHGLKLMSIEEVRRIMALKHDIDKFQNGGTIGIDTNILPEGALHARKNNLSELNPDLEDATKKGIPVMAADGGQVGEQVAEIEHSEIIFRLDVTKRLEELRKDGSEDAMIEAGKLIAEELIENTQDNVGMITEEVQDGK